MSKPQRKLFNMRASRRRTVALAVLCTTSGLLSWGCLAEWRVHDPTPAHRPALETVCCGALDQVMLKIDKTYRRAQRLPVRKMRDRNYAVMEDSARQIAEHAAGLESVVDLTGTSPEDRAMFERLADRLGTNARALTAAAAAKNRAGVRESFAKVTSTCNSCHAAFRGPHHGTHNGDSQ